VGEVESIAKLSRAGLAELLLRVQGALNPGSGFIKRRGPTDTRYIEQLRNDVRDVLDELGA
jgi:hypothetical protein